MIRGRTALVLLTLGGGACVDEDQASRCEIGRTEQGVLAEDRNILGAGAPYPGDKALRGRAEELHRDQQARRLAAWATVAKVLAPVALNKAPEALPGASLPRFQTWYGKDDLRRIFQRLVEDLAPTDVAARLRFEQAAIDDALGWNVLEVESLKNWPLERREAYLAAIDDEAKLGGIGGIGEVSYSPDALRHLLRSYPEIMSCRESGVPNAVETGTEPGEQQAQRVPVELDSCGERELGPFFVAEGESLRVTLEGAELAGSQLILTDGEGTTLLECAGDEPCELAASGEIRVRVTAPPDGMVAVAQVDYVEAVVPFAACLEESFPSDAVVVKASWHRAQFGLQLPVYDTDAASLQARLAANEEEGWGPGQRQADPGPEEIYSVELPNGQRYRLAGLHIMSKELDHWQWVSLWWSDVPTTDFGEDRPESFAALGAPWSNYKMCTATFFDEGDSRPDGGYGAQAPTLASALEALHGGPGAPSWCSNPYIEDGAHNMATNCIGCHQHGGTELSSNDIIGTPTLYPSNGRQQERNNFPHDYSWAIQAGDKLALAFKEVLDFYAPQ